MPICQTFTALPVLVMDLLCAFTPFNQKLETNMQPPTHLSDDAAEWWQSVQNDFALEAHHVRLPLDGFAVHVDLGGGDLLRRDGGPVLVEGLLEPPVDRTDLDPVADQRNLERLLHTLPTKRKEDLFAFRPGDLVDGLPTSFQLVGRPFAESTLLRAGAAYEAASEFSTRVPTAVALD